jgi:hypothetical protein
MIQGKINHPEKPKPNKKDPPKNWASKKPTKTKNPILTLFIIKI